VREGYHVARIHLRQQGVGELDCAGLERARVRAFRRNTHDRERVAAIRRTRERLEHRVAVRVHERSRVRAAIAVEQHELAAVPRQHYEQIVDERVREDG
jgi:hypothetical protein